MLCCCAFQELPPSLESKCATARGYRKANAKEHKDESRRHVHGHQELSPMHASQDHRNHPLVK